MKFSKALLCSFSAIMLANSLHSEQTLTIYNNDKALVKDDLKLDLKEGVNKIIIDKITACANPDSVILSDPSAKNNFTILEQSYNSATLSNSMLLNIFEGQTIDFKTIENNMPKIIKGKIIRSGLKASKTPIIEVDGKIMFSLPGVPLFPALTDKQKEFLYPTISWSIFSEKDFSGIMTFSYLTRKLSWDADYNLLMEENTDDLLFCGWITMDNQSGKDFEDVNIKLLAGDLNKSSGAQQPVVIVTSSPCVGKKTKQQNIQQKAFDEYYLYSLKNKTTLKNGERKQVEFVKSPLVKAKTIFIYDCFPNNSISISSDYPNNNCNSGVSSNNDVTVFREFMNSKDNNLGIPLPKGRVHFYKKNGKDDIEFIGENDIAHTPQDEKLLINTGNSFDIKGERTVTDYNSYEMNCDETVEIKIKNHKNKEVTVKAVDYLFRWTNWTIKNNSDEFSKIDSNIITFEVKVPANGEKIIKYTVCYQWEKENMRKSAMAPSQADVSENETSDNESEE